MFMCYARIWLLMTSIVLKYRAKQGKNSSEKRQSAVCSSFSKAEERWFFIKGKFKGQNFCYVCNSFN